MRILTTALVLAALAVPLAAESPAEAWVVPFAAAYQPAVAGFNTAFAAAGLPVARARHFGWGIELRSLVSGVLVGPLYFRTSDGVSNNSFSLNTVANGIFGVAGLKLAPVSFLAFVPQVGAGGISQSYTICQRSSDIQLPDLLTDPGRSAVISSGMKLGGLAALEIDGIASFSSGRYGLSLRGGYLYSPFRPTWHLDGGAAVTGAPDSKLAGLFLSAGIVLMPAPEVETGGVGP